MLDPLRTVFRSAVLVVGVGRRIRVGRYHHGRFTAGADALPQAGAGGGQTLAGGIRYHREGRRGR